MTSDVAVQEEEGDHDVEIADEIGRSKSKGGFGSGVQLCMHGCVNSQTRRESVCGVAGVCFVRGCVSVPGEAFKLFVHFFFLLQKLEEAEGNCGLLE